jgi:hypothetical protein
VNSEVSALPAGDGAGVVKEFVPLEAYEEGLGPAKRRMALVMAALWGVPMTVYQVMDADGLPEIVIALVVGVAGALAFGFLWTWTMTFGVRRLLRRVYGGDPRIVPAPPAGAYEYRFPCSFLPSLQMAIGGHLYLGPAAWKCVPHTRNLKRHRTPVCIPITPGTQVEAVEVKLSTWMRIFTPGPAYRLQVRSADADAMFLTPDPRVLAPRLREYLQTASATPE